MDAVHFRLHADFTDLSLIEWYHTASVGDLALVEIPSRACVVELRCWIAGRVGWSVQGGRSLTMPLLEALMRLQLLSTDELPPAAAGATTVHPRMASGARLQEAR